MNVGIFILERGAADAASDRMLIQGAQRFDQLLFSRDPRMMIRSLPELEQGFSPRRFDAPQHVPVVNRKVADRHQRDQPFDVPDRLMQGFYRLADDVDVIGHYNKSPKPECFSLFNKQDHLRCNFCQLFRRKDPRTPVRYEGDQVIPFPGPSLIRRQCRRFADIPAVIHRAVLHLKDSSN